MRRSRSPGREAGIKPTCLTLLVAVCAFAGCGEAYAADSTFEQRGYYLQARERLRQGQISEFRRLSKRLQDYPLRPYLDYYYLRSRLSTAPTRDVLAFARDNADLPVTDLLFKRWLRELGKRRQWDTLREHYRPTSDPTLRCYHLRSLYGTGEKTLALDQTTSVWLQPESQPEACDPLFEVWRQTPRFTENVVWQRFEGALVGNERSLARYLIRYLSGANRTAAEAFYAVHVSPTRIARTSEYRTDNARYRKLIAHGLRRLAQRDIDKADAAWQKYRTSHGFDEIEAARIESSLAISRANDGRFPSQAERARISDPNTCEDLANAAVKALNWAEASYWIDKLPNDLQVKAQWQYWLGRALHEDAQGSSTLERADSTYQSLARQRHYYGFLAARQLGLPGRMNESERNISNVELARIRRNAGLTRSTELFAVGDDLNGRREWYAALTQMSTAEQIMAAELAQTIGLTAIAIRTANIAEATDHLHLRFPLAFEPQFRRASLKTALQTPFLMAIARQESAMEAAARSSADARGLMQLLPSTARLVARRANLSTPTAADLYDPGTNIALGSYHLAWLMARYDDQSPLAIAAYNAGEHRVDRWIKDAAGVPMDVWIERIPFRETRNYVKNVLAFRHVYGDKLRAPAPVLGSNERIVRLPAR